jgi:hypothetical protein
MATTNAAIVQANNAMKKLNTGVNAQVAANAGQNVSQNLAKMNTSYTAAANGFRGVARKTNNIGLKSISNSFNAAANAAEAAAAVKAARNAKNGLNKLKNAMAVNMNRLNQGQVPASNAGIA